MQIIGLILRRLSVDIVLGAVVGAQVFAFIVGVEFKISTATLLAGTVWLIYIADHIADSFATQNSSQRHYFYYKHRKPLAAVAILICITNMFLLTLQSTQLVVLGAQLLCAVLVYLIMTNLSTFFKRYLKEIACAVLYSVGISLPAAASASSLNSIFYVVLIFYILSAWINLLSISLFELDYDKDTGYQSLAVSAGRHITLWVLSLLFMISAILLVVASRLGLPDIGVAILAMIPVIQVLILYKKQYFLRNERYRIAGDLLYLLPAIVFSVI